jgi:maleate isomerase
MSHACPLFFLLLGVVCGTAFFDVHGSDFHILPFKEDHGAACRARLGVILLSVDETVESEYGRYLAPFEDDGVVLYHARQFKGPEIDVASLKRQKAEIVNSSKLLPLFPFSSVAFACTSIAAVLGADVIAALVAQGAMVPEHAVTNPLTAAMRALRALNASKVAILTPYTADVTKDVADAFAKAGLAVTTVASFNQTDDKVVSRIRPASVLSAVKALHKLDDGQADAIFVSCTNTRTLDTIARAEKATTVPMVSSNSAMAWDLLRLGGLLTTEKRSEIRPFGGALFDVDVPGQTNSSQCP